jgi:hypothetical protein
MNPHLRSATLLAARQQQQIQPLKLARAVALGGTSANEKSAINSARRGRLCRRPMLFVFAP